PAIDRRGRGRRRSGVLPGARRRVSRELFLAFAERLTEPLLLLSPGATVLACNRAASRAIGCELESDDLASRAADPAGFRRYIALASRSASPLPGSARFVGVAARWRCDASVVRLGGDGLVVLRLRASQETVGRFLLLNEQISRLQAE